MLGLGEYGKEETNNISKFFIVFNHYLSALSYIPRVHFGRSGKFSQHSPFRCVHIFLQKLVMISESFFQIKAVSYLFSKACYFSFFSLFFSLPFLSYYHLFISFFSFSLWKGRADEGAHYLLTSNHKENGKKHVMVSRNKNSDKITESHNAKF